ncbi:hypothetical protein RhiirA5_452577 [Rhizophagus irregularis]|uniref:CCHC-type domain-containing protein n=1 Tax=Rhizophagus irregularis TaxID=588596 RepID=A0A2N0P850_9GLOM|nr:hypothetical protein RhiirA5_452577 [Rhizophagus irregularis]
MRVEQAYIDLLDSNLELRIKLTKEETITIRNKEKIRKLTNDLERCELYIKYLEKNLISRENEIDRLKAEYYSTLYNLKKCQDHLELKEEALVAQDNRIILLEDTVEKLKSQILKISHFQNNSNKPSEEEEQENMALPDILRNVGTALDRIERYINGDTSFDPRNTLNGIWISLTTVRGHMQRHAQDAINLQGQLNTAHNLLNNANGQINNFINDMANVRNECLRRAQLLTIAYNNEANERRRWYQIAQERQTNGQRMAFRKQNQINILVQEKAVLQILARRRKAEADLAEFNRAWVFNRYQKWKARELNSRQIILNLQNNPLGNMATIQDVMHTLSPLLAQLPSYDRQEPPDVYYQRLRNINETARSLAVVGFNAGVRCQVMINKMTGRFAPVPANDPYAGGNPAIVTEPLFLNWLCERYREVMVGTNRSAIFALVNEKFLETDTPDKMRVRIANPPTVNAFFTELCNIWHESAGKRIQAPAPTSVSFTTQPQKDDFKIRLARDLAYTGIGIDDATLENFIYEELKKRLGGTTAHVRKSPFTSRSAYATKKVIRKVVPKASAKQTRHCSACGKAGHTKVNCPKGKRTKKVNYVYQDEVEDPEDSEEYIVEEEEDPKEEEIEDDDEYVEYVDENDDEPRNCYATKKKWCKVEYL